MGQLDRITSDPAIFGGKPIVRGMRISVELILSLLAQGETQEAILEDYPGLQPEDIRACLAYCPYRCRQRSPRRRGRDPALNFLIDRCAGQRLASWLEANGHDVQAV